MHDFTSVRRRYHSGRFERLPGLIRIKPARLKQMQTVSLPCQRPQKLHKTAPALFGVGMRHHHGVLRRVPVSEADPSADFNKRGKAGKHDVDLALIQIPEIEFRIHSLVRGLNLQPGELFIPKTGKPCKILVCPGGAVLFTHGLPRFDAALPQQEQKPRFFPRREGQRFFETSAMIAALLKAAGTLAGFYRDRVLFGSVWAQKAVAQTVKAVRVKACREELIAVLFIEQIVFDHSVGKTASGGIKAHLEVSVIHIHMVKAELEVREHRERACPAAVVSQTQIPDFNRIIHCDKERLLGSNAAVVTAVFTVTQSVAAGVVLLWLAHRLPGDRPVIPVLIVTQVQIVTGSVHRNAVGPEAGNAVIL